MEVALEDWSFGQKAPNLDFHASSYVFFKLQNLNKTEKKRTCLPEVECFYHLVTLETFCCLLCVSMLPCVVFIAVDSFFWPGTFLTHSCPLHLKF